jgi:hypothetical protein
MKRRKYAARSAREGRSLPLWLRLPDLSPGVRAVVARSTRFMFSIANAHAVAANGAAPASAQARALRTTTGTATVFGFIVRLRLRTQARRRELRLNAETAVFRVAALASAEEPPAVVGDGLASSVA